MKIKYIHNGYPERRNIISNIRDFEFVNSRIHVFKIIDFVLFKRFKINSWLFHNIHVSFFRDTAIYHLFNGVGVGPHRWVSTFETSLPRISKTSFLYEFFLRRLLSKNCKGIIAISKCSMQIFSADLERLEANEKNRILGKTVVLHPPQKQLVFSPKQIDEGPFRLVIVGSLFFLKGGYELIKVVEDLKNAFNLHLTIISDFALSSGLTNYTQEHKEEVIQLIESDKDTYTHFNSMSNESVLKEFIKGHLAFLPSYADTYGYSVLEAQASGCPVVTTDIRALGEINNDECGYLIRVPKDDLGYAKLSTMEDRNAYSEVVCQGVYNAIISAKKSPEEYVRKSSRALERIREKHNPIQHAEELKKIYLCQRP